MSYESIFSPLRIRNLTLSNRIVVPPLVVSKAAEDGTATPSSREHYAAFEGMGLVVVEATVVSPEGRLARKQLGIFEDRHVEGLSAIAKAIHDNGAAAAIQIHHAGRNTSEENTFGLPLVAPSAFESKRGNARELRAEEIDALIQRFVTAAQRARAAGFDAVEVHAAHGYLISQFLSPLANRRTDAWGGSLENRARFLRSVLSGIRHEAEGLLAYCRLGVADGEPGGLPLAEGMNIAAWLQEDGVPLLHVSSGIGNPPPIAPEGDAFSHRFHLGMELKKKLSIPIISVGDIRSPEQAESALSQGATDLVAVGRGFLVDQKWAKKAREGRDKDIVLCKGCGICKQFLHPEKCPARN